MTAYTQTPERLIHHTPTAAPYIPDVAVASQLAGIAEQMLDEHPGESVLVAQAPYFWNGKRSGSVWCEISDVRTTPSSNGRKIVTARALSGREIFPSHTHGGWAYYDTTSVYAASLQHVAIVEDGRVTRYEYAPNLRLVSDVMVEDKPAMPEWCGDEGSVEYRLQQQELKQEVEGENEGALSNVIQIGENKFRATRPDGKVVTITIPED